MIGERCCLHPLLVYFPGLIQLLGDSGGRGFPGAAGGLRVLQAALGLTLQGGS